MDLTIQELLRVTFDAADMGADDLPASLADRVAARALLGPRPLRHPSWAGVDAGVPLSSLDAYIQTAMELADSLDTLTGADWGQPTRVEGATVRDIVGHLVGVERYVLGQLGRRPPLNAPRREDHWSVARQAAGLADEQGGAVAAAWWREALDVVAACGEMGADRSVEYHHLSGSVRGLLVVRTFELWTHGDDIRGALGLPLSELDETRLTLMVNQFMTVLPLGLALSGATRPGRMARVTLTGAGGGHFDVPLSPGEPVGHADIHLTTDVLGICRLAANRLPADELTVVVEGDRSLLEPILVGATAFACD